MPSNDESTLTLKLSSNMATRIFQTILSLRSLCCTTGVMFLPCPLRPAPNISFSLRKNTEWTSLKCVGSNHYHKRIK